MLVLNSDQKQVLNDIFRRHCFKQGDAIRHRLSKEVVIVISRYVSDTLRDFYYVETEKGQAFIIGEAWDLV